MQNNSQLLTSALVAWQPQYIGTLVYVQDNANRVLLIHKLTGHGQGLINGPGGKLEPGEQPLACAKRELFEEVGLQAQHLQLRARLRFVELNGPQWFGFAYVSCRVSGNPISTAEAQPEWFDQANLPFANMWPSDHLWLPQALQGQCLDVAILFDEGQLRGWHIAPVTELSTAVPAIEPPAIL